VGRKRPCRGVMPTDGPKQHLRPIVEGLSKIHHRWNIGPYGLDRRSPGRGTASSQVRMGAHAPWSTTEREISRRVVSRRTHFLTTERGQGCGWRTDRQLPGRPRRPGRRPPGTLPLLGRLRNGRAGRGRRTRKTSRPSPRVSTGVGRVPRGGLRSGSIPSLDP
jgi:hypothetical protein